MVLLSKTFPGIFIGQPSWFIITQASTIVHLCLFCLLDGFILIWVHLTFLPPSLFCKFFVCIILCFYLSFEFSFYHFLYLSHLFYFFVFQSLPSPPFPTSSSSTPPPPPSPAVLSTSPEPSAPPQDIKCSSTSSTSLLVSWHPPPLKSQNGVLAGYRVRYEVVGPSEGGSDDDEAPEEPTVPATEEQVLLQRLDKWTQYHITVSALTAIGPGPESEPLLCRTDEDGT